MHVNTKHRGEGVNETDRSKNLNVTVVDDTVDLFVDMFKSPLYVVERLSP